MVHFQKPTIEEVDSEITVVGGCAIGFVSETSPPHVLHVEPGSEMEKGGVKMDDILYKVNGKQIAFKEEPTFLGKEATLNLIKTAIDDHPNTMLILTFIPSANAHKFIVPSLESDSEDGEAEASASASASASSSSASASGILNKFNEKA